MEGKEREWMDKRGAGLSCSLREGFSQPHREPGVNYTLVA